MNVETSPPTRSEARHGDGDEPLHPDETPVTSAGRLYRSPRIRRWSMAGVVFWAGLPALLVGPSIWLADESWPPLVEAALDWSRAVGLFGGPVILFLWSVHILRGRGERRWMLKSAPLTVTMISINAMIVFGGGRLGRSMGGSGVPSTNMNSTDASGGDPAPTKRYG